MAQRLCPLADLPEGSARGFEVTEHGATREIFVVHRHGVVRGYRNSCPHTGATLNWLPDQFLDIDGTMIQCAVHGALFRIDDGVCLFGPCVGKGLERVGVEVRDGVVWLRHGD